jgi:hypothetical protein
MIVLPAERVKNGRQHEVPLPTQALAILERLPRRNTSDYVRQAWFHQVGPRQEGA